MFCEKYIDRGILYLYDELDPDEKQAFEAHLHTCHQCQAELALLKENKLFAMMLPIEEIEPISYEEISPVSKSDRIIFKNFVQPFLDSIRSIFQNKRRLALVPVGAAFLILMIFYLFNPGFNIFRTSVSPYSETVFDWDFGFEESLDSLDQKIVKLKSENLFMETDSLDNTFYSHVANFSDQHIDQIAAEIQSLSSEMSHLNF